jgi:beta-N-acetylhexosaminidase
VAPEKPATLAREAISELLREELGYKGPILTDDLEMKAIADHYGIEKAACGAIDAGADLLLICSRVDWLLRAHTALCERAAHDPAFRTRLGEAAERGLRLRRRCPPAPVLSESLLDEQLRSEACAALERELSERLSRAGSAPH